ncbi:hypothetical protein EDD21DRAFT_381129 [Dissophora ornata]|nr:hypothetical protein EDD21DRAFT_381129 [Dissophora ornata]
MPRTVHPPTALVVNGGWCSVIAARAHIRSKKTSRHTSGGQGARHVSAFQPPTFPLQSGTAHAHSSTSQGLPSSASAMSQMPNQTVHYEREPLLHQPHVEQATNHVASYPDSSTSVDRLQHHREMVRDRYSVNWWLEWGIILFIFSVTGSSTMLVVKPLMKALGFNGSLGAGPWSFRLAYIFLTLPLYSCMLLLISSLFCRRLYFEHLLIKMWGRLLPKFITDRCSRQQSGP